MQNVYITPPDDVDEGGSLVHVSDQISYPTLTSFRDWRVATPYHPHEYEGISYLLQEEHERRKKQPGPGRLVLLEGMLIWLYDNLNNPGALPALPQEILCDDATGGGDRRPFYPSSTPSILTFPSARKWVDDVPRPTPSFGLWGEHDTVASVDHHFGTNSAVLESPGQAIPLDSKTDITNVPEDAGPPCFSLDSLITTQCPSYESASTQTYPLASLLSSNSISDCNIFRDVTAKDPEALLDTQNFNVTDASQTDPSIIATALITALGLLTGHSSNPKVAVFQLSAAAVSFTLVALHSFHSKTLADTEQHPRERTSVQRLLKHFPPFIFASCWILFLLSITFTFPKPMSVAVCLVVFASIPMVCGARLPAALTLAVVTLFTLTFFTLVFLVCVLPTEWLV